MLIRTLYLFLFLIADFISYSIINKKGWIQFTFIKAYIIIFLITAFLHIGFIHPSPYMVTLPVFLRIAFTCMYPVAVVYLFFNFIVKRIAKLWSDNESMKESALDWSSLIFLKLSFIFYAISQAIVIFSAPLNNK